MYVRKRGSVSVHLRNSLQLTNKLSTVGSSEGFDPKLSLLIKDEMCENYKYIDTIVLYIH